MPHEQIVAGLATALRAGALTADAVALEARKAADTDSPAVRASAETGPAAEPNPTVASLTQRRLNQLPPDTRKPPSVAAYDQLLRHHGTTGATEDAAEEGTL